MRLCLRNSFQNQRKPNFASPGSPSAASFSAASCRTSIASVSKRPSAVRGQVSGVWLPASKYKRCVPSDLTTIAGLSVSPLTKAMQGKAAFARVLRLVRKPSACSASTHRRSECGAGKRCKSSDGSNGTRLIWHRLPISQTKSVADNAAGATILPCLATAIREPPETP